MVGRTLDRYRLLEQVGQGGMAVVYRALDVPLEREVAVKVLHPHLTGHAEARARLQREARAVAKLRHENILEIFASSGEDSPESYLVTEFIHGPTLKAFITEHPLPLPELGAMIASEVALALGCAHAVGVIHRDIKPENVMIRQGGTVVLCDFGIAQVVDKDRMTATGQLLGSPAYMAPEHIDGRPLDPRSDIFSLGVLLYQLITSELPFRGRNPHETLKKIADGRYAPPEELQPLCGARLGRIVKRALCREPEGRYADVGELRADLLGALAESGVASPRDELRGFFADPEGWVSGARPRIGRALVATGLALRAQGRTAAALDAWGRAQALLPDDPEVAGLIRGVARRSRLRRAAAVGAAGVAICALLSGAVVGLRGRALRRAPTPENRPGQAENRPGWPGHRPGWPEDRPGQPEHRVPGSSSAVPGSSGAVPGSSGAVPGPSSAVPGSSSAVPGSSGAVPAPPGAEPPRPEALPSSPASPGGPRAPSGAPPARTPGPVERVRHGPRGPNHPPRPRPRADKGPAPTPEPAARRLVHLAPLPKAVQVSLNGRPLGAYGTDVTTVELPPGPAELLFENPACYSERVVIPADADPGDVRVRLRWKPALLLVRVPSGPKDVDVVVEGRLGRAGQVLAVPLRTDDGRATVEVKATAAGYRTLSRPVEVRANQLTTLDISLEPG